ncbi:MAG: LPS export ABC transporter periplasmic protein LptC, partial [Stellaceae bacterium]
MRKPTGDPYSRCVARLKLLLPAVGLALLLLVAAWPRLAALFESVRIGLAAIDLREARELKMVDPRYAGLDRQNRPYVLTA